MEARREMEMTTTDMNRTFHRRLRHEDLRDRAGTSGTTKGSSECNKRKFADWQTMKLGSENLSAMYQFKTDGCNNTG